MGNPVLVAGHDVVDLEVPEPGAVAQLGQNLAILQSVREAPQQLPDRAGIEPDAGSLGVTGAESEQFRGDEEPDTFRQAVRASCSLLAPITT